MGKIWDAIDGLKPTIMMVMVQAIMTGVNVFYKLAANIGMSLRVLIAYRFLFAAACLVPIALLLERKEKPKLTWFVLCQAFLSALFGGSMAQNFYAQSLALTSATFAAAMINLVPAFTFVLAVCFGLEKLGWETMAGKAKVAGTLLCIGGAMLLTFYKGPETNPWSTNVDVLEKYRSEAGHVATSSNPVLGALLAVGCCISAAVGLIVQAKLVRNYPHPYSMTALMMIMGSIQSVAFAICLDQHWSHWKLGWNIELVTVGYTGIVASVIIFTFTNCCVQSRGPLFASVFNPLMLVFVAIVGSLILNEKLHLGTLIGSVLIVCGLYVVLWGKGREMKRICELLPSQSLRGSGRADISARQSSFHSNCSNPLGVIPNGVPFVFSDDLSREVSEPSDRGDEDDDENKDFEDEDKHEGKEGSS